MAENSLKPKPKVSCEGCDFSNIIETIQISTNGVGAPRLASTTGANIALGVNSGLQVRESEDVHFVLPSGRSLPAKITVTWIGANTAVITVGANGGLFQSGGGDAEVRVSINKEDIFGNEFDDVQFGLIAGSIGPGEIVQFVAANPVTEYAQGGSGQNIAVPYPAAGVAAANWNNNNSNATSGFAFGQGVDFVVNMFGQNGVGSVKTPVLLTIPAYIEDDICSLASKVLKNADADSGIVTQASAALVTTNGVSVAIGDDYILFADGTTWANEPLPTPTFTTVDSSAVATYEVAGDGNQNGGFLTLSNLDGEAPWTQFGATTARHNQQSDFVLVFCNLFYEQATTGAEQRISPAVDVIRADGTLLRRASTGYQRHFGNHNESSNGIAFIDKNPPADAQYRIQPREGNTSQTGVVPVTLGHVDFMAVTRKQVRDN